MDTPHIRHRINYTQKYQKYQKKIKKYQTLSTSKNTIFRNVLINTVSFIKLLRVIVYVQRGGEYFHPFYELANTIILGVSWKGDQTYHDGLPVFFVKE